MGPTHCHYSVYRNVLFVNLEYNTVHILTNYMNSNGQILIRTYLSNFLMLVLFCQYVLVKTNHIIYHNLGTANC